MSISISPGVSYRLANTYTGREAGLPADMGKSLLHAHDSDSTTSRYWQFTPVWGQNKYHICTEYCDAFLCIDIHGKDKTKPWLTTSGYFTGLSWNVEPLEDGTHRMTNDFSGVRSVFRCG